MLVLFVLHDDRHAPPLKVEGEVLDVTPEHDAHRKLLVQELNAHGFRVVAVAHKVMPGDDDEPHYTLQAESNLTLLGYMAFLDPPKDSAMEALRRLNALKVDVKILTGEALAKVFFRLVWISDELAIRATL